MKSSPSTWHLLHNVKSTVKISSHFVAFLENINFKSLFVIGSDISRLLPKYLHVDVGRSIYILSYLSMFVIM